MVYGKYCETNTKFVSEGNVKNFHLYITFYNHYTCRNKVIEILRVVDPVGVKQRRKRRLKRRIYRNKV